MNSECAKKNSSASFVRVCMENSPDDTLALPLQKNGSLALSTLQAYFPGATALKYKKEGSDDYFGVRVSEGFIYFPEDGSWANTIFVAILPKFHYAGLSFVKVCNENSPDDVPKLFLESNGTLALSTLQARFPGATCLKYKTEKSKYYRAVQISEGYFYLPEDESLANTIFIAFVPKSVEEEMDQIKRVVDVTVARYETLFQRRAKPNLLRQVLLKSVYYAAVNQLKDFGCCDFRST